MTTTCRRLLPLALVAVLAVSCAMLGATKIAEIKASPLKYEGKTVSISGEVTATHNLLVVRYFTVRDDTGEIAVVTQSPLPEEGQKVHVKGTVDQAFAIGDTRLLVIVEEAPPR
jgi:photosystem II stability/assembly factor-like uncharacterized protein